MAAVLTIIAAVAWLATAAAHTWKKHVACRPYGHLGSKEKKA